jgi:hypothetical protein
MDDIPKYDNKEPSYNFILKVTQFNVKIKEADYNEVINLLNKYFEVYKLKFTHLLGFKGILHDYFENTEHNKDIMDNYGKQVAEKLNIKYDLKKYDKKEVLRFFRRILSVIDYSLIKRINFKEYYYIKRKNQK